MNEFLMVLIILVGVAAGLAFYFLPSIIAFRRHKTNRVSILVINIFLGWSFIGWIVALVWALKEDMVDSNGG